MKLYTNTFDFEKPVEKKIYVAPHSWFKVGLKAVNGSTDSQKKSIMNLIRNGQSISAEADMVNGFKVFPLNSNDTGTEVLQVQAYDKNDILNTTTFKLNVVATDSTVYELSSASGGGGGGGSQYVLPTASTTTLGGVKVNGIQGITIAGNGTIGINYGANLTVDNDGRLSAAGGGGEYVLPPASDTVLGGVKVALSSNISVDNTGFIDIKPTTSTSCVNGIDGQLTLKCGSELTSNAITLKDTDEKWGNGITVDHNKGALTLYGGDILLTGYGKIDCAKDAWFENGLSVGNDYSYEAGKIYSASRYGIQIQPNPELTSDYIAVDTTNGVMIEADHGFSMYALGTDQQIHQYSLLTVDIGGHTYELLGRQTI